jgi:hypothetical protein
MLDFVFVIVGLLCLLPLLILAKGKRKQVLVGALPRAVEIAASHGWVSPGRLMTYANLTEKDARDTLAEAAGGGSCFKPRTDGIT